MHSSKYTYGIWRTDKPKEDGFSHELISPDSYQKTFIEQTNLDELFVPPFPGVDTITKALQRNAERIPNNDWLGTRNGNKYEWMTFRDAYETSKAISFGFLELGLCPENKFDDGSDFTGRTWRMIGIQSKNRREWVLTNLANCLAGSTTVAFYDTLGADAGKYIINQTELTTMVVSNDYVKQLCKWKEEDKGEKMHRVKNLVVFEAVNDDDKKLA